MGAARGTPDVSLNAAVDGGVWVYYTFVGPSSPWHIFGGTSAATPEGAGSRNANASCTGAMSFASVRGNLDVPRGSTCTLTDSVVSGVVTVEGTLTANGSTVVGSVQDLGGGPVSFGPDSAGEPTIVQGSVQIMNQAAGTAEPVLRKRDRRQPRDPGQPRAVPDRRDRPVRRRQQHRRQRDDHEQHGLRGARGRVLNNTIAHNLQCLGNSLTPTGGGNTVGGAKQFQCAGL